MSAIDREALRARAREFVHGPAFDKHFEKLHIPRWVWLAGQTLRCLTIVGLPGGLRGLANTRNQPFATEQLKDRYRQLVDTGRVVQAFVILNSPALSGNPTACAPALMLASLDGTDEGDAAADDVTGKVVDRIHLGEGTEPADKTVEAMVEDEVYQPFRKRPLPPEFTGGKRVHFLDVKIDNELLRGNGLFSADKFYFVVDPTPEGLILQIPQALPAPAPPPLPANAPPPPLPRPTPPQLPGASATSSTPPPVSRSDG